MVKNIRAIQTINTNDLVKKADYNTKIDENERKIPNHDKCVTTQEFNKLTAENVAARLKQTKLASKDDIADFVKNTYFDEKLTNINKKSCFKSKKTCRG